MYITNRIVHYRIKKQNKNQDLFQQYWLHWTY